MDSVVCSSWEVHVRTKGKGRQRCQIGGCVLQVLQTAAAAAKVCWKRDALDDGLPLLAPIEGTSTLPEQSLIGA